MRYLNQNQKECSIDIKCPSTFFRNEISMPSMNWHHHVTYTGPMPKHFKLLLAFVHRSREYCLMNKLVNDTMQILVSTVSLIYYELQGCGINTPTIITEHFENCNRSLIGRAILFNMWGTLCKHWGIRIKLRLSGAPFFIKNSNCITRKLIYWQRKLII